MKDLHQFNLQSLLKYQDVTVKLLSDKDYIMSEEYLNDDSYLDFRNSQHVSSAAIMSPSYNVMKQGLKRGKNGSQNLKYLNYQVTEYSDGKQNLLHSDSRGKYPLKSNNRQTLDVNIVDFKQQEPVNFEDHFNQEQIRKPLRTFHQEPLNNQILSFHSYINNHEITSQFPQIRKSVYNFKNTFVENGKQNLLTGQNRNQSEDSMMLNKTQQFLRNVKSQSNLMIQKRNEKQVSKVRHGNVLSPIKGMNQKSNQPFVQLDQPQQVPQFDAGSYQQMLQHQNVLKGLQELQDKKEKRRDILNIKNYNKFRQKIANEDRKFHLLAHNLCDNLKRAHVRLDVDDYKNLKAKIKQAIDIKYNKKPQSSL
eukprot:403369916